MAIDKDIKRGLKISFGIVLGLSLFFGIVFAIGFHSAEEILGGTFNGNFIFEDNVSFNGQVSGIESGNILKDSTIECNSSNSGLLKYNSTSSSYFGCDGFDWREISLGNIEGLVPISDSSTVLALHFDNNFIDHSLKNQNVVEYGEVTFGPGKFGSAAYFNPSTVNYLEISSSEFNFGSADFTIDYWIKTDNVSTGYFLGNKYVTGGNEGWGTYGNLAGGAGQWGYCAGTTCSTVTGTTLVNDGNWHHIAYVKSGSNHMIFTDGVLEETKAVAGASVNFANDIFSIGRLHSNSVLTGYIDEVRISKGIARWTTDFTVPSEPYS